MGPLRHRREPPASREASARRRRLSGTGYRRTFRHRGHTLLPGPISRDEQGALADLDTGLRELGTVYVDIWYLHLKNMPADVTGDLVEAQRIAKQQGPPPGALSRRSPP
jgi:hypothetical protein